MIPNAQDRATFAALADRLIPAYRQMPAASAVKVEGELLDLVLRARPDLQWQKLAYPGQAPGGSYDPHETPDYLLDGTLERVVRRGPLYRPTPR
jgi:hypothetical protein